MLHSRRRRGNRDVGSNAMCGEMNRENEKKKAADLPGSDLFKNGLLFVNTFFFSAVDRPKGRGEKSIRLSFD